MSTEEPEVITLSVKVLGLNELSQLQVPADLETDSLFVLAADMSPSPDFRVLFRGKVLKPGQTLLSCGISDGDTIVIVPKKESAPPPPAEDPEVPELVIEFDRRAAMRTLVSLQTRLAETGSALVRLNASLYGRDAPGVNSKLQQVSEKAKAVTETLGSFASESQVPEGSPISASDRAEMERLRPTLEAYANANQLANTYRSQPIYNELTSRHI